METYMDTTIAITLLLFMGAHAAVESSYFETKADLQDLYCPAQDAEPGISESVSVCGHVCSKAEECRGFFYTSATRTCNIRLTDMPDSSVCESAPGSRYFQRKTDPVECAASEALVSGPNGINDSSISASSVYRTYAAHKARLDGSSAWSTDAKDQSSWLQFDFSTNKTVTSVTTQGQLLPGFPDECVTSYHVLHSATCAPDSFVTVKNADGITQDSPQSSAIIAAVDRLTTERHLVADGSRDYCLPTIPGKHSDLQSISCDTMADVVAGKYDEQTDKVTIVDCRYPYEFQGGHIRGAVNLYAKDAVQSLLETSVTSERHVLIFHCEFSSERGPKMYRFLRSQDRELNKENYPGLNFPEVYLLDGGYKAFYNTHMDLCDPISYKPMLHEDHVSDLRLFRVKSKSWTAGEKQRTSRRCRSRFSRGNIDV